VRAFFAWLDAKHVAPLAAVRTYHVSAYVEGLGRRYRAPTVKQHLAAIRMLFDWLIVGQIFAGPNPAAAVRGPKHVVKKGKTSVLDGDEAKKLLDSIDATTIVGLRDRALIALLIRQVQVDRHFRVLGQEGVEDRDDVAPAEINRGAE
jgi:site-specific recombinase XerD